jgi:hypothetical protein
VYVWPVALRGTPKAIFSPDPKPAPAKISHQFFNDPYSGITLQKSPDKT